MQRISFSDENSDHIDVVEIFFSIILIKVHFNWSNSSDMKTTADIHKYEREREKFMRSYADSDATQWIKNHATTITAASAEEMREKEKMYKTSALSPSTAAHIYLLERTQKMCVFIKKVI